MNSMKIKYFVEMDTLYIEFRSAKVAETRDLDENTLLDPDAEGNICAIPSSTRRSVQEFRISPTSRSRPNSAEL
jgi:uncharacterized protein YuzE